MPTYLLIDDDIGAAEDATLYAEALQKASDGTLTVDTLKPDTLPKTLEAIAQRKPDGLLLDVALTNALTDQKEQVGFDGIALAQQVRTLQTRGRATGAAALSEFPIIRFSKKDVIREYVNEDPTSDDLFDEMIDKGELLDSAAHAASRALSLAEDYPRVVALAKSEMDESALSEVLGCNPDFLLRLDPRTLLGLRRQGAPAHALARYFTAKLLARPGPLVDHDLLAVRLGVDSEKSEAWPKLMEMLAPARYGGAFGGGYPRWWWPAVIDWWQEKIDSEHLPNRLAATERIDALSAALGFAGGVVPLAQDEDSPGERFWHICYRSGRPVDPAQGFALLPMYGQESWQDADYLCLEEAMRDPRNPRLGPPERSRLAARLSAKTAR
ncbi:MULTISPECIES: hypothetical protein [unclassified Mesorhizobium]|uniref:hypothetical protein n=1 Tax=unclassified Mesorhizobium TaxID=325217 RepID=UPI000FE925D2|nr:hypothetical protein [Mesorhizobium sp.]RWP10636.1 MAG: hypothetical protein EOQ97_12570 [Mesorhizobium sp.]